MFYSSPLNALAPGRATVMSDGWETARRRDDGNDWLTVQLAAPGALHNAVIDTSCFIGNAPGWASLTNTVTGAQFVPRTRLQPDTSTTSASDPPSQPPKSGSTSTPTAVFPGCCSTGPSPQPSVGHHRTLGTPAPAQGTRQPRPEPVLQLTSSGHGTSPMIRRCSCGADRTANDREARSDLSCKNAVQGSQTAVPSQRPYAFRASRPALAPP